MTAMQTARCAAIAATTTIVNGGATIDPVTCQTPRTGYVVAVPDQGIVSDYVADTLEDAIRAFVDSHRGALAPFGRHLGTWLDDGKVYLDVVEIVPDLVDALARGQARGERAIYDLANEITLPITVETAHP